MDTDSHRFPAAAAAFWIGWKVQQATAGDRGTVFEMPAELAALGGDRRRQRNKGLIPDTFLERFDFHRLHAPQHRRHSAKDEPGEKREHRPHEQRVEYAAGNDPGGRRRKRDGVRGRRGRAGTLRSRGAGNGGNEYVDQ